MSMDINALVDYNLNLISTGKDIRRAEFKNTEGERLGIDRSLAIFNAMLLQDLIIEDSRDRIFLSAKGHDIIASGGWLSFIKEVEDERELDNKINVEKRDLEILNLKLQNENLVYAASIREKEDEIRELTKKNLKNTILYSVISAVIGSIITLIITFFVS